MRANQYFSSLLKGYIKIRCHSPLLAAIRQRAERHAWPGNVRELENWIKWVLACQSHLCDMQGALDVARRSKVFPECADALAVPAVAAQLPLKEIRHQAERQRMREVMEFVNGGQRQACEILKIR